MRRPLVDTPTTTASGKIVGRPPKQPPADAAERIRIAAAGGANVKGMAAAVGANADVLGRWLDEYPKLREAMDEGREQERHTLHNVLYRQATEGEGKVAIIAAMFLLKSRHGYREGDQSESANKVSINFQMPGAMPLADFIEVANADGSAVKRVSAPGAGTSGGN